MRVVALTSDVSRASVAAAENVSLFEGDLLSAETLEGFVSPGAVVVNLAYLRDGSMDDNLRALNNLLDRCEAAHISRFIHCSTAVVVGRSLMETVTEATPCAPVDDYEHTKLLLEEVVTRRAQGKFACAIVRPTAVFGEGGLNLVKTINDIRRGNRIVDYIRACIYHKRSMNLVCVENVVAAIEHLLHAELAQHNVFIVSDDDDPLNNYIEVRRMVLRHMGQKQLFPSIPLPPFFLSLLLKLAGRSNVNPYLKYSPGSLVSSGFTKRISFAEGLEKYIVRELASGSEGGCGR